MRTALPVLLIGCALALPLCAEAKTQTGPSAEKALFDAVWRDGYRPEKPVVFERRLQWKPDSEEPTVRIGSDKSKDDRFDLRRRRNFERSGSPWITFVTPLRK